MCITKETLLNPRKTCVTQRWKVCKEFPDYSVSDTGLIKNTRLGHTLFPSMNKGKLRVTLTKYGINYFATVAALVYTAFVDENLPARSRLIYIDNNPKNLHYKNIKTK